MVNLPVVETGRGKLVFILKVSAKISIFAVELLTRLPGQLPVGQEPIKVVSWT